ncbi:MAG: putative quinol monooxygenase [Alphaproteobacteria bacterium]
MLAVIATLRTKEGMGAEFEAVFAKLQAAVRANEPGNKLYQLTKPVEGENVYKVLEIYENQEAVEAHRASTHFKELGAALGPYMAGRAEIERLETL